MIYNRKTCREDLFLIWFYWFYGGGSQIFVKRFARLVCVYKAQGLNATYRSDFTWQQPTQKIHNAYCLNYWIIRWLDNTNTEVWFGSQHYDLPLEEGGGLFYCWEGGGAAWLFLASNETMEILKHTELLLLKDKKLQTLDQELTG